MPKGASRKRDRATRASHRAPAGLHHSAGIPCAKDSLAIILDEPRWAVVGRCQDYHSPEAIGFILRDKRDWLARLIKRVTAELADAEADVFVLGRVIAMLSPTDLQE